MLIDFNICLFYDWFYFIVMFSGFIYCFYYLKRKLCYGVEFILKYDIKVMLIVFYLFFIWINLKRVVWFRKCYLIIVEMFYLSLLWKDNVDEKVCYFNFDLC